MFLVDRLKAFWRSFKVLILIVYTLAVAWAAGRFLPRVPLVYRVVCGVRVIKYTPPRLGELTILAPAAPKDQGARGRSSTRTGR